MKKPFIVIALALLLLCSCINQVKRNSEPTLNEKYAKEILRQLNNESKIQPKEWFYTSQTKEPKENDACVIDFYTKEPTSYSIWLCQNENQNINCELIRITFYYN